MPSTTLPPPAPKSDVTASPSAPEVYQLAEDAAEHETRNFVVMALYGIVMRTGWIFKTESIVMPAVLDAITGGGPWGGFLRGWLPVLNRFGHSIPPILFSRRLKVLPRKRVAMMVCTTCMASVFLLLSAVWWATGTGVRWWMPLFFLVAYVLFFCATGINNLAFGTLQGKLIQATHRGRLLLTASVVGATSAIIAVALLMPQWLTPAGGQFEKIFGFTGVCFAGAGLLLFFLKEPRDDYDDPGRGVRHLFGSAWEIIRTDANFRRLAWVAMAFSSSMTLFPHYQALGRSEALALSFDNIWIWLIVQNTGTALFSLIAGPIADRHGNRIVMQYALIGLAAMPIAAIGLSHWQAWGATLYPAVFLFIGLTPVAFMTFNNYTLEICDRENHSRYLSTLGLCFALPLLFSPILGWVVEATNFEVVFLLVSGVLFIGWLLTFRLIEPRHALHGAVPTTVVPEDD